MKITFFYILISASLFSCGQTKTKEQPKEKFKSSTVPELDKDSIAKTPDRLKGIVNSIAAINEVQQEHVGIAGTESENYQNFLQFKRAATIDELLKYYGLKIHRLRNWLKPSESAVNSIGKIKLKFIQIIPE